MKEKILNLFRPKKRISSTKKGAINLLTSKIYPKEEAKQKFKHYFEKLHNAIYSDYATNIAITGSYGSGKTTIIKNYQNVYDKKETQREYLNISLATFKEEEVIEKDNFKKGKLDIQVKTDNVKLPDETKSDNIFDETKEKQNLERLIEISILQQILYHVKPSTIPNSNLKRIRSIKPKLLRWITGLCLIWFFVTAILFKFNYISKMNPENWDVGKSLDWFLIFLIVIFVSGLSYIINKGIRLLNNTKISKLKFLQSELELGKGIDKSILNEHLDEIIYFFEKTNFDVVVFEDIDRFENTEIFTKLRELNHLLNNSKLIKRDLGKIVFIYAVRDDKFKNEERTKFFDYIIPIIPFISPTNSNEQLWKLIKNEGLENIFSNDFINDVTNFIDEIDMRLLINIFNEFLIYKSKVLPKDDNRGRNDNLLAIVIYKNLHPKDFAELSQRNGKMFKIISDKNFYIKKLIIDIENKIKKNEVIIKDIEQEEIKKINELKSIYINMLFQLIPDAVEVIINHETYNVKELLEEETFKKLLNQEKINYKGYSLLYRYDNNYSYDVKVSNLSFSSVESRVDREFDYLERENNINNKTNNSLNNIKKNNEKLERTKIEVESWDLSKIFQELNTLSKIDYFKDNKLINYLLLNGYINENYHHYISLFHEENLSKEDFDFEKKVKSGENNTFDFKLIRIENLIKKLNEKYFEREFILNFDLLNHLLENRSTNSNKIKLGRLIKQLSNEKKRVISFIDSYIEFEEVKQNIYVTKSNPTEENNIEPFIKLLCKEWVGFWNYIYLDSNYSEEKTKKYIKYIIQYADIEDLVFFTNGSNINTYVMQQRDFLDLFEIVFHDKVKEFISGSNVKFEELQQPNEKTKFLFDFVYENNNYKINLHNISVILDANHKDKSVSGYGGVLPDNFQSNNFEVILDSECTHLINYINKEINEYVKKVYLKTEMDNEEKESILVGNFLNNKLLHLDLKIKIIDQTKTVFSTLQKVGDLEFKKKLIQLNKIRATWNNIYSYLNDLEDIYIDNTLINFYNEKKNYEMLSQEVLVTYDKDLLLFYKEMRYAILKCDELSIEAYSNLILSINKSYKELDFKHLSEDKVKVLVENSKLNLTESNYDKLRGNFINQHVYLIEKHQDTFLKDVSLFTLDEEDLTLLFESDKFLDSNKIKLLEEVTPENLANDEELSKTVLDIVLKNKNLLLSLDKINNIFSHKLTLELKINFLTLYGVETLSKDRLIELIALLPNYYKKITTKSQTIIPKTKINKEFVEILQQKGIVGKVKENNYNEYRLWMKKL